MNQVKCHLLVIVCCMSYLPISAGQRVGTADMQKKYAECQSEVKRLKDENEALRQQLKKSTVAPVKAAAPAQAGTVQKAPVAKPAQKVVPVSTPLKPKTPVITKPVMPAKVVVPISKGVAAKPAATGVKKAEVQAPAAQQAQGKINADKKAREAKAKADADAQAAAKKALADKQAQEKANADKKAQEIKAQADAKAAAKKAQEDKLAQEKAGAERKALELKAQQAAESAQTTANIPPAPPLTESAVPEAPPMDIVVTPAPQKIVPVPTGKGKISDNVPARVVPVTKVEKNLSKATLEELSDQELDQEIVRLKSQKLRTVLDDVRLKGAEKVRTQRAQSKLAIAPEKVGAPAIEKALTEKEKLEVQIKQLEDKAAKQKLDTMETLKLQLLKRTLSSGEYESQQQEDSDDF